MKLIFIDVLDKDTEAVPYLLSRADSEDIENASWLAERLGCLPLAIEQAAAYIANNPCVNFSGYIDRYNKNGIKLFGDEYNEKIMNYNHTVLTTWMTSMDKIKMESAEQLLRICSYFAPDSISISIFIDTANTEYNYHKYHENSAYIFPEQLMNDLLNDLERDRLINNLKRYSLIKYKNDEISIHRLLQEVIRDKINNEIEYIKYGFRVISEFSRHSTGTAKEIFELVSCYLPHVCSLMDYGETLISENESHILAHSANSILMTANFYADAVENKSKSKSSDYMDFMDGTDISKSRRDNINDKIKSIDNKSLNDVFN